LPKQGVACPDPLFREKDGQVGIGLSLERDGKGDILGAPIFEPSANSTTEDNLVQPPSPSEVTRLLKAWGSGNTAALDRLMPIVYSELRSLAARYLRQERQGHTLQPTALVNEAYLRLIDQKQVEWQNRAHFIGVAAQMMRRILVDHAKHHQRAKRGGGIPKVSLDEAVLVSDARTAELVELDDALVALAQFDERKSRVVELRYFGGLSVVETAEVLKVSEVTVARDWKLAKAWLYTHIEDQRSWRI
jgi:RNA polymerase sigma factor (TIGR02999 family)